MRALLTSALFVAISTCVAVGGAAADEPASCEAINAARRMAPAEEVAQSLDTTRARVAACDRVARSQEASAERRARVEAERAARAVAH